MSNKLLLAAIDYLKLGWSVIPLHNVVKMNDDRYICTCDKGPACDKPGKHPRIKWDPYREKLPTENELRNWWRKWPKSNVGIITGQISKIIVLDIDGERGLETLRKENYIAPPTVINNTGRGWHYVYAHPGGDCRNFVGQAGGKLLPDVDFRGDGGLFVAPPSRHYSGGYYEWGMPPDMHPVTEAPGWLVQLIHEQAALKKAGRSLSKEDWSKKLKEGQRNSELTRRVASLLNSMDPPEVLSMAMAWNKDHCDPPYTLSEVQTIVDSMARIHAESLKKDPTKKVRATQVVISETGAQLEEGNQLIRDLKAMAEERPREIVKELLADRRRIGALAMVAHNNRAAVELVWQELRDAGVLARDVQSLQKVVNSEKAKLRSIRLANKDEEKLLVKVNQVVRGAPCPEAAVVPDGWHLAPHCVGRLKTKMIDGNEEIILDEVCSTPLVITGRLRDINEGHEHTRIAWLRDGRWQSHTIERRTIANARNIVELAALGLPVTSGNSAAIVDYLAAFEAVNIDCLPRARVTSQLGWIGKDGKDGFLWGRRLLCPDGETVATLDIDEAAPTEWKDHISFRGADAGDEQIAEAFCSSGTLDGWRQAVEPLKNYPRGVLAVYAALAPPFLAILGAPNFVCDWAYGTSTGKTTVLRVAASCWGNPDERANGSALWSWDVTPTWVEQTCGILNGLPLILDDTKRARRPANVAKVLYDVTSGRGRGRGSLKGMRRTSTWSTVLLSSGEAAATSFTQDGGTRARVLTLWGAPFGSANSETARVVQSVDAGIKANYGEPGKALVLWLLKHRDMWPKIRAGYEAARKIYLERSGGNSIAGRLAAYFAVLQVVADVADYAIKFPWEVRDPVAEVWEQLINEAEEGDRAESALAMVYSWAQANQKQFWGRAQVSIYDKPSYSYAGRWDEGAWEFLGFFPHKIKEIIEDQGFEHDPIIRMWKERGWLDVDGNQNRMTKTVRYDNQRAKMVVIKRSALERDEES